MTLMEQAQAENPILVVDDTEAIRYAKVRTLQKAGYTVLEASTGADAISLAHEQKPPLVRGD